MELKINLDGISVNDYEDTVASILRSEITQAIRSAVSASVKAEKQAIQASIQKMFKGALSKDALDKACKKVVEDLLK